MLRNDRKWKYMYVLKFPKIYSVWQRLKFSATFQVLRGAPTIDGRPGEFMDPLDFDKLREDLESKHNEPMSDKDLLSSALYPKVFDDYVEFRHQYGPVDTLDTRTFLVGPDIADEIQVWSLSSMLYSISMGCQCSGLLGLLSLYLVL